jgi:hypothetical protein
MTYLSRGLLTLCLLALLVGTLLADDAKKPEKKPAKPKDPFASVFSFSKKIKLDDKQQEKLDALKKEYTPQLTELAAKRAKIMTPERVQKANDARKKAQADGEKDKKVLNKIYNDTLALTKDEQKELGALNKEQGNLNKEINTKKMAILTDEQKEAIKPKPKTK